MFSKKYFQLKKKRLRLTMFELNKNVPPTRQFNTNKTFESLRLRNEIYSKKVCLKKDFFFGNLKLIQQT